jgi:hypothetical protein
VYGDVVTVGRWKPIPLLVWTTGWKAYPAAGLDDRLEAYPTAGLDDRLEAYPTAGLDDRLEAYPTCESVTTHHATDRLRFLILVRIPSKRQIPQRTIPIIDRCQ